MASLPDIAKIHMNNTSSKATAQTGRIGTCPSPYGKLARHFPASLLYKAEAPAAAAALLQQQPLVVLARRSDLLPILR